MIVESFVSQPGFQSAIFGSNHLDRSIILHAQTLSNPTAEVNENDSLFIYDSLDQAHNAIERKLFAMKGFHHPNGSQQAFLTGLVYLYNLVPYQRRAQHAGQCGVEVEGGRVPIRDWWLNLQILTSGGCR